MKPNHILLAAAAVAVIVLILNSAYTVGEQEQVVITQFGEPVGGSINADPSKNEAGLHFKVPFIQTVNRFEKRILEWDGPSTPMATKEKQTIVVNAFARWRISDPLVFFKTQGDERRALSRLDDTVGNAVKQRRRPITTWSRSSAPTRLAGPPRRHAAAVPAPSPGAAILAPIAVSTAGRACENQVRP